MPFEKVVLTVLGTPWPLTLGGRPVRRQGEAAPSPVQTHVLTTDRALRDDSEPRLPTRLAANASLWEHQTLSALNITWSSSRSIFPISSISFSLRCQKRRPVSSATMWRRKSRTPKSLLPITCGFPPQEIEQRSATCGMHSRMPALASEKSLR